MKRTPGHSAQDLGFFFEPWHAAVAQVAADYAAEWPVPNDRDDRQATIDAARQLAAAGLTNYCVPEAFGGAAVGQPNGLDTRCLALMRSEQDKSGTAPIGQSSHNPEKSWTR